MKICGIQKLTLLDFPGKTACTIFTAGCNFRCPFCHNASLVTGEAEAMANEDVAAFLKKRAHLLDGVCITGGEPLLQPDIEELIRMARSLGYAVKLDTNGALPDRLERLIRAGALDYIAMDIKSSPAGYAAAAGLARVDIDSVFKSVSLIMGSKIPYEFRTTAVRGLHTADDFREIGKRIAGAEKYFIQEFRDSGDLINKNGLSAFDKRAMEMLAEAARAYVPNVCVRGV